MSRRRRSRRTPRLYDKLRGLERIVQLVEARGSLVHLTLRDPKTGAVSRDPFTLAMVERRFEVLEAESSAFRGDAQIVSLVAEAHRLAHSYLFNPIFAIETSLIDPLPHQLLAVYDHLLKQP